MSQYLPHSDIEGLQQEIMVEIDAWVRTQKTPIGKKDILFKMESKGQKDFSVLNAIAALVKKGYIRKSSSLSRKTYYIQLRNI